MKTRMHRYKKCILRKKKRNHKNKITKKIPIQKTQMSQQAPEQQLPCHLKRCKILLPRINRVNNPNTYLSPPSSLMFLVLKLVWQPAPFQLPGMGLGSKDTTTPKSSHTRCRMKRAIQR